MNNFGLFPKSLSFSEFSQTVVAEKLFYFSFNQSESAAEELDQLFNRLVCDYGSRYVPLFRLCDAEYMFCLGIKKPLRRLSLINRISFSVHRLMIYLNIKNQKTWHGENYSTQEKKRILRQFIDGLKIVAQNGFLAPHLLMSPGKFCEEYNKPIVNFFYKNNIKFDSTNYFPFYFVYIILSLDRYKKVLFQNKNVLIITSFNERKRCESFKIHLESEGISSLSFYEISSDKAMHDTIDHSKIPEAVDLVLIGAGIGSVNILTQLKHLKAICIDAGHALDCFSSPDLRNERIFTRPNDGL